MGSLILRRSAAMAGAFLVACSWLALLAPPAGACSCAAPVPVDEAIESAEWVFIGRQVARREAAATDDRGWSGVLLEVEVVTVYKGEVPAVVELRTGYGSADCGVDLAGWDEVGLTVTPDGDGIAGVSTCGGRVLAEELRLAFEPLPARVGTGPPGFLVGTDIGPARVAVLDTAGELLTYAPGQGRLAAAAVCPEAKKVVEIVEPRMSRDGDALQRPTLEVRDLASLDVERTATIDFAVHEPRPLNGMGWIFDLQCHDPDAGLVTYLLPSGVWDALAGSNLPGPAQLHIWRGESLVSIDAGTARAGRVDPVAEQLYAITGIEGTTLETRDLSGNLLDRVTLPQSHVGWRLALSADGSEIAVLARHRPMERENWFFAEVDRILVLDRAGGPSETYALPSAGFARLLDTDDGGYVAAVAQWEAETMEISRVAAGEVELLQRLRTNGMSEMVAVGSATIVAAPSDEGGPDAKPPVRMDRVSGLQTPIHGLVQSRLAIVLPVGTEILDVPPTAAATKIPEESAAPTTTLALDTSRDQDPVRDEAGSVPETGRTDSPSWPLGMATGLLAIAAGLAAVTLVRRSRGKQERP